MKRSLTDAWILLCVFALLAIGAVAFFSGCEVKLDEPSGCPTDGECPNCPYAPWPPADIPKELRQANYSGGSCVHASTITALRYCGEDEIADRWRSRYAGGEDWAGLTAKAEKEGLVWAGTSRGDEGLLEWASRTERMAVVFYDPAHCINFLGFLDGKAVLLDNNSTGRYRYEDKDTFIRNWKGYGGVAFVPAYTPPPPKPWR